MDMTGDLGTKIQTAVTTMLAGLPGIEQPIIDAFKLEVSAVIAEQQEMLQNVQQMESKAAADAATLESEALKRVDDLIALIRGGFTVTITPKAAQ